MLSGFTAHLSVFLSYVSQLWPVWYLIRPQSYMILPFVFMFKCLILLKFYFLFPGIGGCRSYYFFIYRYKEAEKWGIFESISSSVSGHTHKFCSSHGTCCCLGWFWDSFLLSACYCFSTWLTLFTINHFGNSHLAESPRSSECHFLSGVGATWLSCLPWWAAPCH